MSRKARVWLLIVLLLLAGGTLLFRLLPERFESALRASVNDYLRERTLAMLQETDVAGLSVTFGALDLSLAQRHLIIRDIRIRYDHRDSTRYTRFEASTPEVALEGLDPRDVIKHENFSLDGVRIREPVLSQYKEVTRQAPKSRSVAVTEDDTLSIELENIDLDSLLYQAVAAWLPREIRQARIQRISLEKGSMLSVVKRPKGTSKDSIGNFSIDIRGVGLDSLNQRVFEGVAIDVGLGLHVSPGADSARVESVTLRLDPKDTVIAVKRIRTSSPNPEKSVVLVTGIRRSQREGRLTVDSVAFGPRLDDEGWLARNNRRRSRIRLGLGKLEVKGTLLRRALGEKVDLRRVSLGNLTLDVLADRRFSPGPPKPRTMWPQRLAGLDWSVRIDTIAVKNGTVRYGEINQGRPEVAQLYFSDINALWTNVGNKEGYGRKGIPISVLSATAKLMGSGAVFARIETPQGAGTFTSTVTGGLGDFQGPELNPMLLLAAGVTLKSGRIDTTYFDFHITSGLSAGRFSSEFDSLSLGIVNRVSQKRGIKEKLMGKVANALIRNDNTPGKKSYRPEVPIRYELKPSDSFWGTVWQSIKAGLLKMMKD